MRRTILMRFCLVLVVALFINSAVSYYFMGNKLLGETEKNLRDMIHMIEYTLDYDKDISEQVTGIVSDKRISGCVDRVGEGCFLLLRCVLTAMALFLIVIAVVAYTLSS